MRRLVAAAVILCTLVAVAPPAEAAKGDSKKLVSAQRRANQAAARLSVANSTLARSEQSLKGVRAKAAANRQRLSALEGRVKALAVRQYVTGDSQGVDWLSSDDPSRAARTRALARFVTNNETDAIDSYRAAKEDLEASEAGLAKALDQHRAAVAKLRKERAAALVELNRLAAIERAAAARRTAARGRTLPGGVRIIGSGSWICPVQGPRSFTNDWGAPRSGGRRHQGTDILAPRGTPAVAPVAGTARAHNSGKGGLSYYLAGADGNTYYGAHLSSMGTLGRVAAGTVIGYVGSSGNASGGPPHLHFEIHPGGGGPINPYPTLRAHC